MPEKTIPIHSIETTVEVQEHSTVPSATISIGGVALRPSSLSLRTEVYKAGNTTIGGAVVIVVSGYAFDCDFPSNFQQIWAAILSMSEGDCTSVIVECQGSSILNGCGRIVAISADEGPDPTWTTVAPYSIEVEVYTNNGAPIVKPSPAVAAIIGRNIVTDYSETASLTLDESAKTLDIPAGGTLLVGDAHAKYNFDISVTGGLCGCECSGMTTGMTAAENVVQGRVGQLGNAVNLMLGHATNFLDADMQSHLVGSRWLHSRTVNTDALSCTIGASGSFIIRPNNCDHPMAFTTLTAEPRADVRNKGEVVVISGSAKGLNALDITNIIRSDDFHNNQNVRMANARAAFGALSGDFDNIARAHLEGISDDCPPDNGFLGVCDQAKPEDEKCPLRLIAMTKSYSHGEGTISWTYEYSTEKFCSIPGASSGYVEITDNYPTDVLAEFVIPFRGGAFLQNLGTQTKHTKNLNATVSVDGACGGVDYQENLACILNYLQSLIPSGWYKTAHSETTSTNGDVRISMEFTQPSGCS